MPNLAQIIAASAFRLTFVVRELGLGFRYIMDRFQITNSRILSLSFFLSLSLSLSCTHTWAQTSAEIKIFTNLTVPKVCSEKRNDNN